MKLDRLFAITMLILNRNRISAEELAGYFEVSVRTIYRDLESINQAGIPIIAYPGKNGGFGIMENYKIDRHFLTPNEIFSIITALKGVIRTIDDQKISNTVEKLQNLLPGKNTKDFEKKQDIVIDFSPWSNSKAQKERVNTIRQAIEECKIIFFDYIDSQGADSKRNAEPLTLYLKGNVWYLTAYCRVREDFRFFRLSRMKNIKISGETFIRREFPDDNTMSDGWGNRPCIEMELLFKPHARVRIEDYFEPEQIIYQPDGNMRVKISFPEDEWVYGFVLGFGDDVEVLKPDRLRNIIKEKGKKIWEIYK